MPRSTPSTNDPAAGPGSAGTQRAPHTADAVVCGAGIAGAAAAWALAERGLENIVIAEAGDPLSMTSDKSTECYRNWWPGPGSEMTALSNRSIDIMESLAGESGNRVGLNRRGYAFASADPETAARLREGARVACALGAGPLRVHDRDGAQYRPNSSAEIDAGEQASFDSELTGADVLVGNDLIARHFPCLTAGTCALVHVRRAGFLSAQQLGMLLLERARARGAKLVRGRVESVGVRGERLQHVNVALAQGTMRIHTPVFVDAAGPFVDEVASMLGVALPITHERHCKLSFEDRLACVPREAPLLIWSDPVTLPFGDEERALLSADPRTSRLLTPFPAGVHGRPSGQGRSVMLYWTYESTPTAPVFPVEPDPWMPEILMRGMSAMIPTLAGYFERLPRPITDGGYYAKAPDNRPLIGPLAVEGAYVSGAFSGFGIMTACGAGELLAQHVVGDALPEYAKALAPARFDDPAYLDALAGESTSGQI